MNIPRESQENNIHCAAMDGNLQSIRRILSCHEDVNKKDGLGKTPLFYSVYDSQTAAALLLISMGADINVQNNRGDTPLHEAVNCKQKEMVEVFIAQGANLEIKNCLHSTLLGMRLTRLDMNFTPLCVAVNEGDEDIAKLLVDAGANVNVRVGSSNASDTLLHMAVSEVNLNRNIKIVELLLSNGADVHAKSGLFGYTPLYYAKDYADLGLSWLPGLRKDEIVELLKQYGASSKMYKWAEPMHIVRDILRTCS